MSGRLAAVVAAALALVAGSVLTGSPAQAQSAEQHDAGQPPALLCPDEPETADLDDRDAISSVHLDAIDCLVQLGVAEGLGSDAGTRYLPDGEVRRDQMASFVIRTLEAAGAGLPAGDDGRFDDVAADNVHRDAIEQLAAIGVAQGATVDTYDPDASISRDQMASLLLRATAWYQDAEVDELAGGETNFDDIDTTVHAEAIAGSYHLGITRGASADVTGARYEPASTVTREQMASFLVATSRAMLSDPATCTDPALGYHLTMPEGFDTNPGDVLPHCRVFDTDRFALDTGTEIAPARPIRFIPSSSPIEDAVGPDTREELDRDELTVDGQAALRVEARTTEESDDLVPPDVEVTTYAIDLPDDREADTLVAATYDVEGNDYPASQTALDTMIESLSFEVPDRVDVASFEDGDQPFTLAALPSHDGLCTQALTARAASTVCQEYALMDELGFHAHRIDEDWTIHAGSVATDIDRVEIIDHDGQTEEPDLIAAGERLAYTTATPEHDIDEVHAYRDGQRVAGADLPD